MVVRGRYLAHLNSSGVGAKRRGTTLVQSDSWNAQRSDAIALSLMDGKNHIINPKPQLNLIPMRRSLARRHLARGLRTALLLVFAVYLVSLAYLATWWTDDNLFPSARRLLLAQDSCASDELNPPKEWGPREFQCLRWVATDDDGDTTGEIRECWQRVRGGDAGFCEVRNSSNGQIFRVMRTTSLSLKEEARFTCRYAERFTNVRHQMSKYTHDPPLAISTKREDDKGIVMAVYNDVLASAYASIRQLRDVGCTLPIELWTRHDEVPIDHPIIQDLVSRHGPIRLRRIHDIRVRGFYVKTHAVYYSSFTKVLLLDADNFAVRDPTAVFFSLAFRRYGAVFWPDFWHPGNTIFNVHAQSLLWELLGVDYVDMLEQESGQVLIDRARHLDVLEKLMFLSTHRPNVLSKLMLVWGDKDLFRLAWLFEKKPFFFNDRRLPGSLGVINSERARFCGLSMVQYDTSGKNILFVHRNTVKLTGTDTHQHLWQTLQEYKLNAKPPPTILSFNGEKLFNETSCFGVKRYLAPLQSSVVQMRGVNEVEELIGVEDKLVRYAYRARQLAGNTATE